MRDQKPKYPVFYADVQKYKNKKKKGKKLEIKKEDVRVFNCPMDILYQIIDDEVIDLREHKEFNTKIYKEGEYGVKPFFEYSADKVNVNSGQYQKVIKIVKEYDERIKELEEDGDSYHEERLNEFENCMGKLKNLTIKNDAMYTLIAYALSPNNEKIRDSLLVALYDKCEKKEDFLKYFKKTEKS